MSKKSFKKIRGGSQQFKLNPEDEPEAMTTEEMYGFEKTGKRKNNPSDYIKKDDWYKKPEGGFIHKDSLPDHIKLQRLKSTSDIDTSNENILSSLNTPRDSISSISSTDSSLSLDHTIRPPSSISGTPRTPPSSESRTPRTPPSSEPKTPPIQVTPIPETPSSPPPYHH